jgi:hypothetical protein
MPISVSYLVQEAIFVKDKIDNLPWLAELHQVYYSEHNCGAYIIYVNDDECGEPVIPGRLLDRIESDMQNTVNECDSRKLGKYITRLVRAINAIDAARAAGRAYLERYGYATAHPKDDSLI